MNEVTLLIGGNSTPVMTAAPSNASIQ